MNAIGFHPQASDHFVVDFDGKETIGKASPEIGVDETDVDRRERVWLEMPCDVGRKMPHDQCPRGIDLLECLTDNPIVWRLNPLVTH